MISAFSILRHCWYVHIVFFKFLIYIFQEGRNNGLQRQHLAVGKDKDAAKEGSSDLVEEKIRRLPAGGEGWDKKMKRKRSVSSVFHRPVDGDGELKRTMHGRLGSDSGIQNSDPHGFRYLYISSFQIFG